MLKQGPYPGGLARQTSRPQRPVQAKPSQVAAISEDVPTRQHDAPKAKYKSKQEVQLCNCTSHNTHNTHNTPPGERPSELHWGVPVVTSGALGLLGQGCWSGSTAAAQRRCCHWSHYPASHKTHCKPLTACTLPTAGAQASHGKGSLSHNLPHTRHRRSRPTREGKNNAGAPQMGLSCDH